MLAFVLALLTGGTAAVPPPSAPPEPLRLADSAFQQPIEIEIRDLPKEAARSAIQAAFAEVAEIEILTDPAADPQRSGAALAALNAAAGKGAQKTDPRLLAVLVRALSFCDWSEQALGPLGLDLYRLWGLRSPVEKSPAQNAEALQRALDAAACNRLRLDTAKGTAELAAGSGIDLWGFAEGLAVDRAIEVLRQRGSRNAFVQLGTLFRAIGGGPEGRGWRITLPLFPGMSEPPGWVFLRDRSLGIASAADHRLRVGAETFAPYVSQRTGQPEQGVAGVVTWTELAVNAQALAAALMITGSAEGQLRMGSLRPNPSVLWFLGTGDGEPLRVEHHWGEVPKR